MLKVSVGHSEDVDSKDAIAEIIEQCNKQLTGNKPQAGILFCAVDYDYKLILKEISEAYGEIELIGCTTDGEISSELGFVEDSVTLTLFCSDTIEIKAGVGRKASGDFCQTAKEAIDQARAKLTGPPAFCITTPESITINAVEMLKCLQQHLGSSIPIFGELAGDQWNFKKTYQFYKKEVLSDAIPVLLFSGNIAFSWGFAAGWTPIGKKKKVTRAEKNNVFKLDNEPILDFYNHYLGEYSQISSEYPLAVFPNDQESFYLRSPASADEKTKSISFFGDVPEDSIVQLAETTSDNIVNAAREAINKAKAGYKGGKISLALIFSCAARKALLGINTEKELLITREMLPGCTCSGLYGYGELAPLAENEPSRFHNSTFVIVLIGENDG